MEYEPNARWRMRRWSCVRATLICAALLTVALPEGVAPTGDHSHLNINLHSDELTSFSNSGISVNVRLSKIAERCNEGFGDGHLNQDGVKRTRAESVIHENVSWLICDSYLCVSRLFGVYCERSAELWFCMTFLLKKNSKAGDPSSFDPSTLLQLIELL